MKEVTEMNDRERREIEAIEAMIMQAEAERDHEIEDLRVAAENLKTALLEALRIPKIVSWLADKLQKITGK